jgi:hypothetical protein
MKTSLYVYCTFAQLKNMCLKNVLGLVERETLPLFYVHA